MLVFVRFTNVRYVLIQYLSLLIFLLNFQNGVTPADSTLTPLPPEPYDRGATVDIPLDTGKVLITLKMLICFLQFSIRM